jgi:hypothetical protein
MIDLKQEMINRHSHAELHPPDRIVYTEQVVIELVNLALELAAKNACTKSVWTPNRPSGERADVVDKESILKLKIS